MTGSGERCDFENYMHVRIHYQAWIMERGSARSTFPMVPFSRLYWAIQRGRVRPMACELWEADRMADRTWAVFGTDG